MSTVIPRFVVRNQLTIGIALIHPAMQNSGGFGRPFMLQTGQDVLHDAAARGVAAVVGGLPPSFNLPSNGALPYPDIALFSQFGQLFPQLNNDQQGMLQQTNTPGGSFLTGPDDLGGDERARANGRPTRSSGDSRGSGAYASRHQAAEQRRRTRINER